VYGSDKLIKYKILLELKKLYKYYKRDSYQSWIYNFAYFRKIGYYYK